MVVVVCNVIWIMLLEALECILKETTYAVQAKSIPCVILILIFDKWYFLLHLYKKIKLLGKHTRHKTTRSMRHTLSLLIYMCVSVRCVNSYEMTYKANEIYMHLPPVRIIWNQIYDLLKLLVAESIDWVIEIDITHNFTNECTNIPMFTNYS